MHRILALKPDRLDADYSSHIRELLKDYEGKCNSEGFVEKGSIRDIEPGRMFTEPDRFRGYVRIPISFSANVCYPTRGDIIDCQVENINQFGIMAMAGPLNVVVVPPERLTVSPGDVISVKVVHTSFNTNSTQIDVYAKIPEEENVETAEIPEDLLEEEEEQKGGDVELSDETSESEASDEDDESDEEISKEATDIEDDDGGYLSGNEYKKDEAFDEGDEYVGSFDGDAPKNDKKGDDDDDSEGSEDDDDSE